MILLHDHECYSNADFPKANPDTIVKALFLTIITATTIFGNGIVVYAAIRYKRLHTVTCRLLASLATADLALGLVVLPVATITELYGSWIFSSILCRLWVSSDTFLCTASIYNLVMISVDRYVALARPLYHRVRMTTSKTRFIIVLSWVIAIAICLPTTVPNEYYFIGPNHNGTKSQWNASSEDVTKLPDGLCRCSAFNGKPGYVIILSITSFFAPAICIIASYSGITVIARRAIMRNEVNIREYRHRYRNQHWKHPLMSARRCDSSTMGLPATGLDGEGASQTIEHTSNSTGRVQGDSFANGVASKAPRRGGDSEGDGQVLAGKEHTTASGCETISSVPANEFGSTLSQRTVG